MAAAICPHCGGSNPPGAAFCQYCGSAIPSSEPSPLPSSAAPPATSFSPSAAPWSSAPPAPPPRRRSRLLILLVVIVVFVLVIGVIAFLLVPPAPGIQVGAINVVSADNVCGLDGASSDGFDANTSDLVGFDYSITGANATAWSGTLSCTISTVSTTTPGFSVTNVSVPLYVPANETVDLTFSVQCPGSDYSGNLTLVMT